MEEPLPELVRCPPVLVCGFARPSTLASVFDRVREARPSKLYLWLNRAREDRPDEVECWNECVEIFSRVDWPCEVFRNYSERYLECRDSLQTAFTWFFENVDRGVVLEDDCLPALSFFRFCGDLLEKYKDDNRIGMIAGHIEHLHLNKMESCGDSYYYDRWSSIWGWASWRRAWRLHDVTMSCVPEITKRPQLFDAFYRDMGCTRRRIAYLPMLKSGKGGSWDGAWFTTMQINNWLCIHPYVNLVSNLGVGKSLRVGASVLLDFIHYRSPWDKCATEEIDFPLRHPPIMMPNPQSERLTLIDMGQIRTLKWWLVRGPYYLICWVIAKFKGC